MRFKDGGALLNTMKIGWIVSGVIMILVTVPAGMVGYSGSGSLDSDVPACDSGILGLNVCDRVVMLEDGVNIPETAATLLTADISVDWGSQNVWIAIVPASDEEYCSSGNDGYLVCDRDSLTYLAGGPYSGGTFDWVLEGGDIRFVAGNSMEAASESVTIEYTYNARLSPLLGSILALVGLVQILIGWRF